jgi:hypothetical protein
MKTKNRIETASDLKHAVEEAGYSPHFFTRDTMRFWGDTMRNYGVRQPVEVETPSGDRVMAYELFRRRPVKHGLTNSAWFCAETFRRVHPAQ